MFVIRDLQTSQYFLYKHTKVILFEDPEEASAFAGMFFNYAMPRAMQENPDLVFEVMKAMQTTKVEELTGNYTFDTITFSEVKKNIQK